MVSLLTACSEPSPPPASPAPVLLPDSTITIESPSLGATRRTDVYTPPGYDEDPAARYPVVVLVGGADAEAVRTLKSALDRQVAAGAMRPVILAVVREPAGLGHVSPRPDAESHRRSPEPSPYHRYLERELLTALDVANRTDGRRLLLGGGDAGVFVLDALFASPSSFDDWIVIDPHLDAAASWHADDAGPWLHQWQSAQANLVLAWSGDGAQAAKASHLLAMLHRYAGHGLQWQGLTRRELAAGSGFATLATDALTAVLPALPPGAPRPPSRAPYDATCAWQPFASAELGVRLWLMHCPGANRYEFSVVANRLEQHRPADDRLFGSHVALEVFRKPADQPIADAIREQVLGSLPPEGRDHCVVERFNRRGFAGDKELYTLVPTGAYRDAIAAELQDQPRDFGCGPYGRSQDTRYFEYHPGESTTRFAFVIVGWDEPLFDERSLVFDNDR